MSWIAQRRRRARRRLLARVAAVAAGVGLAALAGGSLLPREHRNVARSTLLNPAEAVWRVLTDLDGFPLWRSDVTRIERLPDADGRPLWREVGNGKATVLTLAQSEPLRRLVTRRRQAGFSPLPELTFLLRTTPAGTEVTLIRREDVGNPWRRVLVRLGAGQSYATRLLHELDVRLNVSHRQVASESDRHGN